jgi:class 3 adenylate cyclase
MQTSDRSPRRDSRFVWLFAGILIVSAGILVSISVLLFRFGSDHRVSMIEDVEIHAVDMRQEAIVEIVAASVSDLLFLSELNEVRPFLANRTDENLEPLARELVTFARGERLHDRITLLSRDGIELLRVDDREGSPVLAAREDLLDRSASEDFRAMSSQADEAIYVSPLDAEEGGESRDLRLGLALRDDGEVVGYILLSVEARALSEAFLEAHPDQGTSEILVNGTGTWLIGPILEDERADVLPRVDEGRFQDLFPIAWATIASSNVGQIETPEGLFTYDTLIPSSEANTIQSELSGGQTAPLPAATGTPTWKNVSWVPAEMMRDTRREGTARLAGWDALGVLVLASGAWAFTRWTKSRSDLHHRTSIERELLQSTLQKYMSPEVYRRLLGDPARHAQLGGESEDVVVLFADIRGFTRFAERHAAEDVVATLNMTLSELVAPLRLHGGILDKYIGDGFLAFFEPSPDLPTAAEAALEAAQMMQRAFSNLRAGALGAALRELGLGVGISSGRVVVGNVGSEDAMDYTIVGDAVNVASRLQDLAEAGEVLLSESAYRMIRRDVCASVMRHVTLRGREDPMDVFKIDAGGPSTGLRHAPD